MELRWPHLLLLLVLGVVLVAPSIALAQEAGGNATSNTTLSQIVGTAFTDPRTATVMGIEFLLGLALGYLAVKVVRYILAFIGILLLGSVLQVWSLGGSMEDFAKQLGVEVAKLAPIIKQIVFTIGLTIVGPASLGFIVGVILANVRK